MPAQITCPVCQNRYVADVQQIVDVGRDPQLKQAFLSGYLNVAQCPNCGNVTQVGSPLLYHDPEHELFMVYVPMELGLSQTDQEKLIGDLVRQAMDSLPPEQRRGYMLQPQTVLSMQTLMERVLETEGITPEMIAHERAQLELLQNLLESDRETAHRLVIEHEEEIDGAFFALLRTMLDAAEQTNQEEQILKLVNLQALLYKNTDFGKKLEKQQRALHALNRDVKGSDGLTPKLLLKHVLANREDDELVEVLVQAGQQAFNYEFFMLLSERIQKRQSSGINADELIGLRERLLTLQQELERRSREAVESAGELLSEILAAEDKEAAVRANARRLDNMFMYVLASSISEAERRGDSGEAIALREIQGIITAEIERQAPPQVRLINRLLNAENAEREQELLDENAELLNPELLQLVEAITAEAGDSGDARLEERLQSLHTLIDARL
jgi:hypothetical protein